MQRRWRALGVVTELKEDMVTNRVEMDQINQRRFCQLCDKSVHTTKQCHPHRNYAYTIAENTMVTTVVMNGCLIQSHSSNDGQYILFF